MIKKLETLFISDINHLLDSGEAIDKLGLMEIQLNFLKWGVYFLPKILKDRKIPYTLLDRMANALSYQLDEPKFKEMWDLSHPIRSDWDDLRTRFPEVPVPSQDRMSRLYGEVKEAGVKHSWKVIDDLKIHVVELFDEIGKRQALSDTVIQTMERLSFSETEYPYGKENLRMALESFSKGREFLTEKPTGSVCENSMRNPQEGD